MKLRTPIFCTLILIYLFYRYNSEKHLKIRNTKIFNSLLCSAILNLIFDIITELPNSGVEFPLIINTTLQTISLLTLFLSCHYIYQYMLYYIELNKQQKRVSEVIINKIVSIIGIFLVVIMPLEYNMNNGVAFLDGPKVYVLYAMIIYLLLHEIIHLIKDRQYIPKKQYNSIVFSLIIFISFALIQMIFPFILISGMGLTLEVLVLYLSLENPDKYIDIETNTFNVNGLYYVLKENISLKNNENLYLYSIDSNTDENVEQIKDFLRVLPIKIPLYKVSDNVYAIINFCDPLNASDFNFETKQIKITNLEQIKVEIDKFAEHTLNKKIYIDKMTGAFNRNKYEIDITNRRKLEKIWYVITDINNLKITNDKFGHEKGDELIKDFANLLRDTFGEKCVYRIGGDEFVVLSFEPVAGRIKKLKEKTDEINLRDDKDISYAIGYEQYIPSKASWEYTTKKADERMYKNKKEMKKQDLV